VLRKGFDNLLIVLYKFFSATMQLHHLMTTVLTHTFFSGRFHNYNFILNKKRAFQTDERLLYIFRKYFYTQAISFNEACLQHIMLHLTIVLFWRWFLITAANVLSYFQKTDHL